MKYTKKTRVLFYGDSNTYGYDPRGMVGGRYPEEKRWTHLVGDILGEDYIIYEDGMNGRQIPGYPAGVEYMEVSAEPLYEDDVLAFMLGTNDILLSSSPNADRTIVKLERIIKWYKNARPPYWLLVIAPVPISDSADDLEIYHEESLRLNRLMEELCKKERILFIDTTDWNVPLAFDGVHFAEEGLQGFAEKMAEAIVRTIPRDE